MTYNPLDPQGDPFRPPEVSIEVQCLHCGESYDSYLIEWRIETDADGKQHGFWCCPTPDCDGRGFGFDIFPTDPDYRDQQGNRMWCDDEEYSEDDLDEDEYDEDSLPNGPTDVLKPGGNGRNRSPPADGQCDDIPF